MQRDEEFIRGLAEGTQVDINEVQAEWDAVASDSFVATSIASGVMSEEMALTYIKSAVHSRFTSLAPADKYNCIIVGFSSPRKPKGGGDEYSELFAIFPELDRTPKIRRISVKGNVNVYKDFSFNPPTYFQEVRLVSFLDGGFQADRRANFENGTLTSQDDDYLAFVPKVAVRDVPKNLAKRRAGQTPDQSFEDSTDWRCITGIVNLGSAKGGERQDGSGEWGMFEVNDMSMMAPVNIDPQTILSPALTCWCPRELVPTDESIVRAYGPLTKNKPAPDGSRPGGYSMNVKMVVPIIKRDAQQ